MIEGKGKNGKIEWRIYGEGVCPVESICCSERLRRTGRVEAKVTEG